MRARRNPPGVAEPVDPLAVPDPVVSFSYTARSELATLSQRLAALTPALAAAVAPAPRLDLPAQLQTTAACISFSTCASVAIQLQLEGSDALRVAGGVKLLLTAGRAALLRVTAFGGGAAAGQHSLWRQQQVAFACLLFKQLHAMQQCLESIDGCNRPDATAVFAATTAASGTLVLWLTAVSEALLLFLRTPRQALQGCSLQQGGSCQAING